MRSLRLCVKPSIFSQLRTPVARPCSCQGAVAKWKGICLQSRRPRFDSEPRLHGGQHWCAGGPYKPVIAPDEGARQSSILWTTTNFTPPSFNGLGHHATNVETGVQILSGVPRCGRVRPIGSATSLLSWRYVSSNLTAPSMPGSSNGKMCARLAQHRGSSPRPGTTPGWFNGRTRGC